MEIDPEEDIHSHGAPNYDVVTRKAPERSEDDLGPDGTRSQVTEPINSLAESVEVPLEPAHSECTEENIPRPIDHTDLDLESLELTTDIPAKESVQFQLEDSRKKCQTQAASHNSEIASSATVLIEVTSDDGIDDVMPGLGVITEEHEDDVSSQDGEPEISATEKEAIFQAVRDGDIDTLDDLLDLPGADINIEWFSENMLIAAIRADQVDMAHFLIDNGINCNYETTQLDVKEDCGGSLTLSAIDWYTTSCRQLAYEHEMFSIVDVIDEKNHQAWPRAKKAERNVRYKTPIQLKLRERARIRGEENETISELISSNSSFENEISKIEGLSSGYSSMESIELKPMSSKRKLVQFSHRFKDTKSSLVKQSFSRTLLEARNSRPKTVSFKPLQQTETYLAESKLWATKRKSNLPEYTSSQAAMRTISPWKDDPPINGRRSNSAQWKEKKASYQGNSRRQPNTVNKRPSTTFLPSVKDEPKRKDLSCSQVSTKAQYAMTNCLSRPKSRASVAFTTPPTPIQGLKVNGDKSKRTVSLDSVTRHRGLDTHVYRVTQCTGPAKKYSPAGHIKTVSAKRLQVMASQ